LSEHTDNPQLEDDEMTRVIDADARDQEEERWIDGDEDELAPRPRGRLLRPLPLFLIALTIAAAGFLGGVLAQKGSEGGSSAGGAAAGGLPSFAAAKSGGEAEGGSADAGAGGTVTSVEGRTIYVKETDGTVVAVKAGDGVTVTRDSSVSAKKVHPGDTVTVEGSKHGSTVQASSIAATEAGVGSTAGPSPPGSGSETEASVESLFEE
jgi:hypothetical protein